MDREACTRMSLLEKHYLVYTGGIELNTWIYIYIHYINHQGMLSVGYQLWPIKGTVLFCGAEILSCFSVFHLENNGKVKPVNTIFSEDHRNADLKFAREQLFKDFFIVLLCLKSFVCAIMNVALDVKMDNMLFI